MTPGDVIGWLICVAFGLGIVALFTEWLRRLVKDVRGHFDVKSAQQRMARIEDRVDLVHRRVDAVLRRVNDVEAVVYHDLRNAAAPPAPKDDVNNASDAGSHGLR